MEFGDRLKGRRKELGLSAEKVAEQLQMSPATIYRYEKGDFLPRFPTMVSLADLLHTSVAFLVGTTDDPTPAPPPTDEELWEMSRDDPYNPPDPLVLLKVTEEEADLVVLYREANDTAKVFAKDLLRTHRKEDY